MEGNGSQGPLQRKFLDTLRLEEPRIFGSIPEELAHVKNVYFPVPVPDSHLGHISEGIGHIRAGMVCDER